MDELIARLADESGMQYASARWASNEQLERFAALVANECAKVCEEDHDGSATGCAFAIRARFGVKP